MLKNYFKIAFRNILRHKAYSAINISGLAIGMASSILILLWVQNELSYDRFHKNADQLYRITCNAGDFKAAVNPAGMPAGLKDQMPEIKSFTRLSHPTTLLLETGDRKFEEKAVFYADSNFLELFSFPLIKGNAATALQRPDAILLTADMAKKYFGAEEAIGKTLRKDNGASVTITGILANIPSNSHLQFDFILPMSAIAQSNNDLKNNAWNSFNFYSYVELNKSFVPGKASLLKLNREMDQIYKKRQPNGVKVAFQLQPMTAIHLQPGLQVDLPGHGNVQYVNIFFVVAIVILIVACINFMNLATARSARRAKEVGLRKVVGALRGQLIAQFIGESLLISFFALLAAVVIVLICLPLFNNLAGKKLVIDLLDKKILTLTGSYPMDIMNVLQDNTFNKLISSQNFTRLINNQSVYGKTYSLTDLFTDLEKGVWGELETRTSVDLYRRNLQRLYIERMTFYLTPAAATIPIKRSEYTAIIRAHLIKLRARIQAALPAMQDTVTRYHLQDMMYKIDTTLAVK